MMYGGHRFHGASSGPYAAPAPAPTLLPRGHRPLSHCGPAALCWAIIAWSMSQMWSQLATKCPWPLLPHPPPPTPTTPHPSNDKGIYMQHSWIERRRRRWQKNWCALRRLDRLSHLGWPLQVGGLRPLHGHRPTRPAAPRRPPRHASLLKVTATWQSPADKLYSPEIPSRSGI